MATLNFTLPLKMKQSKNKQFSLNLNQYRNAHFRSLSAVKVRFSQMFYKKFGHNQGDPLKKCMLEYTIYFPSARRTDLGNIGSIVDKFASDCLVEYGYIVDDNRTVIKSVAYLDGGIDRENPRAELKVIELNRMPDHLIITHQPRTEDT